MQNRGKKDKNKANQMNGQKFKQTKPKKQV